VFSETPVTAQKKRGRPRKVQPGLVQPATRRFTRSVLKVDGYRPKPVIEKAKPKSKPRAKFLLQLVENNEENTAATPLKEKMHEKEKVTNTWLITSPLGTPRGRYDEYSSKIFPQLRNQGLIVQEKSRQCD
jgi:hypothetical protein